MWAIPANRVTLLRTTWRFMKASVEVVIRTSSLRNCDLNDTVGVSLVWNIFRSEEFLSQFFWPKSQYWWLVSCFEVGGEIDACLRVKSFPSFKFEGVWSSESELSSADRSLCLPSGFFLRVRWSVECWWTRNHLIRSPNSTIEFCWCQFFVCRDRGKSSLPV